MYDVLVQYDDVFGVMFFVGVGEVEQELVLDLDLVFWIVFELEFMQINGVIQQYYVYGFVVMVGSLQDEVFDGFGVLLVLDYKDDGEELEKCFECYDRVVVGWLNELGWFQINLLGKIWEILFGMVIMLGRGGLGFVSGFVVVVCQQNVECWQNEDGEQGVDVKVGVDGQVDGKLVFCVWIDGDQQWYYCEDQCQ